MAFPTSPTNGQIATVNGISYTYSSTTNSWTRNTSAGSIFNITTDTFTGDGLKTTFILSTIPASPDLVQVNIDGVMQQRSAYNLSNNTITFTGTPIADAIIEVRTITGSLVNVLTGLVFDSFTGNGSTVNYTLSTAPTNKNYTLVTVGGITQAKSTYSVSTSILTFTTAPASGAPIEVITFGPATAVTNTSTAATTPHPFVFMGS